MRYLILILMLMALGCTEEEPTIGDAQESCSSCNCEPQHEPVELEEVMIEIQNNAEECAVRIWSRSSDRPLFAVKGGHGIHKCKIYIIQNPEIKSKPRKTKSL